jgi:integrase
VAEWRSSGFLHCDPQTLAVAELMARFWQHVESYYQGPDGTSSREPEQFKIALRPVRQLYADTLARDFGPSALKAVRQQMIDAGGSRKYVNKLVTRIKMMFRWAVSEELLPAPVFQALQAVPGLKRGRCGARESVPVKPVPEENIEAIRTHVSRQVWALIRLQLLTGARPGELVVIRPIDLDTSGNIWLYKPVEHKTAWHDHERTIYIGPRGQDVIRPFLHRRAVDAYLLSAAEAEQERRDELHAHRKTPLSCGNSPGTNKKRRPRVRPRDHYDVNSYRRAIQRGCVKAGIPSWHHHQLRHNAATLLRREFGLEAARIILGYRSPAITCVYAELDKGKAIEVMSRIG